MNNLSKRLAALEAKHRFLAEPDFEREPISVEVAELIAEILDEAGVLQDAIDARIEELEREK